jgi:SRSO17 transposase
MERRYEARLEEMLEDAEVPPEMLEGMLTRLETFVEPFAEALDEPAQRRHALEYMTGLLSDLKHKTGEGIAYLHDQQRQGIQKFIGHVPWDHQPSPLKVAVCVC